MAYVKRDRNTRLKFEKVQAEHHLCGCVVRGVLTPECKPCTQQVQSEGNMHMVTCRMQRTMPCQQLKHDECMWGVLGGGKRGVGCYVLSATILAAFAKENSDAREHYFLFTIILLHMVTLPREFDVHAL